MGKITKKLAKEIYDDGYVTGYTDASNKKVIDEPLLDFFIDLVESTRSAYKWDTYQNRHKVEFFLKLKEIREKKVNNNAKN